MKYVPYPPGSAWTIADARAKGLKPAETVLIVLDGKFPWSNPQVFPESGKAYRWDWIRGLSAVVLISANTRLGDLIDQIEQAGPEQLDVIDFERNRGWMVLFTRPRLKTVRWPPAWVQDWLGPCTWHAELQRLKTQIQQQTAASHIESELEPVWN